MGISFRADKRLENMYCNAPVNADAKRRVAEQYGEIKDFAASNSSAQEKYEQYMKMLALTNPVLYTTPLFIYQAAQEKAKAEAAEKHVSHKSEKISVQDRYEKFLEMQAFANPMLYSTPLFIYQASKEKF